MVGWYHGACSCCNFMFAVEPSAALLGLCACRAARHTPCSGQALNSHKFVVAFCRADAVVKDSQDDEEDSAELEAISETNYKFEALQKEVSDLSQKMDSQAKAMERILAALEKR